MKLNTNISQFALLISKRTSFSIRYVDQELLSKLFLVNKPYSVKALPFDRFGGNLHTHINQLLKASFVLPGSSSSGRNFRLKVTFKEVKEGTKKEENEEIGGRFSMQISLSAKSLRH